MNYRRTLVPALALATLAGCAGDPAELLTPPRPSLSVAASNDGSGTYLVRFKGRNVPKTFAADVARLGGAVIFAHGGAGVAAVSGLDAETASRLGAASGVAAVDADAYTVLDEPMQMAVSASEAAPASPTNPTTAYFYPFQWNMRVVDAPAAWAAGKLGTPTTRVGILDTGVDYLHPDLFGRVDFDLSRSFLSDAENARVEANFPGARLIADLNYHGTHVAATVASNGLVAAGITSNVTLVALKVCAPGTPANGFRGTCPTSGTLAAILYAADKGLDVINMSLGGSFQRTEASARGGVGPSFIATINQVMNYATTRGTAIVVSAGNDTRDMDHDGNTYNAYCSAAAVICVSATGPTAQASNSGPWQNVDALASYSNFGRSSVDVAAPGGNASAVWAACSGFTLHPALAGCRSRFYDPNTGDWSGSVVGLTGTSMAAPHVTGLAALLVSEGVHGPAQLEARIQKSADDLGQRGTDPAYGKGRINVANAVGAN